MKKIKLLLLILIVFFMTGCSIERININNNYDEIINKLMLQKRRLTNTNFNGYSLYIPKGLKIIDKDDYNIVLVDRYNNYYYIYVDIVSYYNKIDKNYKEKTDKYYYKSINNSTKNTKGYLQISVKKNKYFVQAEYNYVKIEMYSSDKSLDEVVLNVCELLSNVKYNNKILKTIIGEDKLNYKEETYNIFAKKKRTTNYLDYIEKYDKGASDNKVKETKDDKDTIDMEIDED